MQSIDDVSCLFHDGAEPSTLKASLLNICAIRPVCQCCCSGSCCCCCCHDDVGIKNSTAKRCCQSSSHTQPTPPSSSTLTSTFTQLATCVPAASDAIMKMLRNGANVHGLITKLSGSITATFSTLPGKVAIKPANVVFSVASSH